ncbi:hypothetical protein [Microbaculum marinum]|uniref:Uncharacterized protein n=1 Tax=Microbaculum marinum TaxID=1764581 RepID=A0AAW9S0P9_9HYPH
MAEHHHETYSAWDAAMADLNDAADKLRAAVKKADQPNADPAIADLVDQLSERKRRAMDTWVAYTNASGFGRI